jgi:hypothetical protein
MAPATGKSSRALLATLASCLLLLQLTEPAAQARPAPAAALGRRSLLQAIEQQAAKKPKDDIPMAPLDVLQQSLVAANLSSVAYPGTLLTSTSDVLYSYTYPDYFQK